jgi:hypothetical protein
MLFRVLGQIINKHPVHARARLVTAMGRAAGRAGAAAAAPLPDAAALAKAERIRRELAARYPSPAIPLAHESTFQLLVAVMLSAQARRGPAQGSVAGRRARRQTCRALQAPQPPAAGSG